MVGHGMRPEVLDKVVSEPLLGLTNTEEATSGAAIDHVDRCAGEPLSDVQGLLGALNGDVKCNWKMTWTAAKVHEVSVIWEKARDSRLINRNGVMCWMLRNWEQNSEEEDKDTVEENSAVL
eukprot:g43981.t1